VVEYDMSKKESIKISGMSCAACAARIEKKLNSMEGVEQAAVNLASEKASVEYDSSKLKVSDLIKVVEDLGYQAERAEEVSADSEKEQREKEIGRLRLELIVSAVLTAPLLFAMILMLVNADIPIFHDPYFQLILATPIQFIIGFRFINTHTLLSEQKAQIWMY
jgi:Cu+-exporting ATPase